MNKGEYAIFCKLEKLLSQLPGMIPVSSHRYHRRDSAY